jgi:luciferase family oxidoreductase group 1
MPAPTPLSVLDLSFVREGETSREALFDSLELAKIAETLGYRRFWMAEHHNMEGIASAATSVALGFIAAGTQSIRIGAGGIMLPNHSPLVIAEQFGTLEALFPGRVDLGLGRAPGTDRLTARALRRNLDSGAMDTFPQDVQELQMYFEDPLPDQAVSAVPGAGLHVPIWLLGSSLYSAQLAAHLGLPFAFASHFAPEHLFRALQLYRENFRPSEDWPKPHAMVAANVVVADSDEEALFLFSSAQIGVLNLSKGKRGKMQPPVANVDANWTPQEHEFVDGFLGCSFVGSPATVRRELEVFARQTQADEFIVTARIFDQAARLKSFELLAKCWAVLPDSVEPSLLTV